MKATVVLPFPVGRIASANVPRQPESIALQAGISLVTEQEIRLPQMANGALSEQWLIRETGDQHWRMIEADLAQPSSAFADASGNRIYATFVRVRYSLDPLHHFAENERIRFRGSLHKYGRFVCCSDIKGLCGDKMIRAELATSFSLRPSADNTVMMPGKPEGRMRLKPQERIPELYDHYRKLGKGQLDTLVSGDQRFNICSHNLYACSSDINPYTDVNGAGLLYFANYPLFADKSTARFCREIYGIKDYERHYHTVHRDVCYYANCNSDDEVISCLNHIERMPGDKIKTASNLYRQSDYKLLARVFTVKSGQRIPE